MSQTSVTPEPRELLKLNVRGVIVTDEIELLCRENPEFRLELTAQYEKMQEYLDNGALLGLLLEPFEKRVYAYRPVHSVEVLDDPEIVSGDPVLPGFILR